VPRQTLSSTRIWQSFSFARTANATHALSVAALLFDVVAHVVRQDFTRRRFVTPEEMPPTRLFRSSAATPIRPRRV